MRTIGLIEETNKPAAPKPEAEKPKAAEKAAGSTKPAKAKNLDE